MIEIQEITNQIQLRLEFNRPYELIMDSFVLGYLQAKDNQQQLFIQNVELIKNLREFIQSTVYTKQQVCGIYNKALNGNKNLLQLCTNFEDNIDIQAYIPINNNQNQYHQYQPIHNQFKQYRQEEQNQQFMKNQQNNLQQRNYEDQMNLELAKKLQNDFDSEYQQEMYTSALQEAEMRKLKKQEQDELNNQVQCNICLEVIELAEMATLQCFHIYHQKCLNQYCTTQIEARQFPLICPTVECKKNMIYSDLTEVLDDQKLIEFHQYTFKQYVESHGDEYSWCPTPDCKYVFIADGTQFNCPSCTKSYCLQCKIEYHHGYSCQGYKELIQNQLRAKNEKVLDDQFFQFVQGAKYKQCPQCKFWVEKNQGCDHMTCRCKFQFCYICGGVYGNCACVRRR
ncbi:unnamed protein product [Paramecium sonneborni]|uniref:RBR-type E3 ubiquitin transferase n=1 Tax=Paramecium sonneborni TaxID=65129 RepID=A0A8S1RHH0_9CILI|nr:unnamed protein product [Paramecium sonneborni]